MTKNRTISLLIISTGLLVLTYFAYGSYRKFLVTNFEKSMDGPTRLAFTIQIFQSVNMKWPNNIEELKRFSDKNYLNLDLTDYQNLNFLGKTPEHLKIIFTNKKDQASYTSIIPPIPQQKVNAIVHSVFPMGYCTKIEP